MDRQMTGEQFTAEENEIVRTVARFVEERVRPHVQQLEREGKYPEHLVSEMMELGLFGLAVPESHGGLGARIPVLATILEVLSSGWTTLAAYVNSHSTVAYAIATHGTEEQKNRYLPGLATGEHRGALCLTEAGCGSDLQAIKGMAKKAGDRYDLTASKTYVTNGAKATLLLTLVKHPPSAEGAKPKISLLIVEKADPQVSVTSTFEKTAFHLVDTVQIEMDGVAVPKSRLLGAAEGKGFAQLMDSLEVGRVAIAASAVGLAANALSEAKRYAAERVTFGVTIDQHQSIQMKLAAMAKMYASDRALEIAHQAVVVYGGAGYIRDNVVERLNREALLYTIGEGTNDINRIVIARRMKGEEEMQYLGLLP